MFGGGAGGGGTSGANQAMGLAMMLAHGWSASQWPSLKALWTRESGWNANARNASSGAAGIVQDITGNMHGGARGQIAWGLNYIAGRYGSPAGAWAHSQATNWYGGGGMVPPGGMALNEPGGQPERMLSGHQTQAFDRLVALLSSGSARGGGGGTVTASARTIVLKVDGREMTRVVLDGMDNVLSGGLTGGVS